MSVELSEAKMSRRRRVCVVDRRKLIDERGTVGNKRGSFMGLIRTGYSMS